LTTTNKDNKKYTLHRLFFAPNPLKSTRVKFCGNEFQGFGNEFQHFGNEFQGFGNEFWHFGNEFQHFGNEFQHFGNEFAIICHTFSGL